MLPLSQDRGSEMNNYVDSLTLTFTCRSSVVGEAGASGRSPISAGSWRLWRLWRVSGPGRSTRLPLASGTPAITCGCPLALSLSEFSVNSLRPKRRPGRAPETNAFSWSQNNTFFLLPVKSRFDYRGTRTSRDKGNDWLS